MKPQCIQIKTISTIMAATLLLASCKKDKIMSPVETGKNIAVSQFKTDADGWTITGDAQGGFVAASYSPDGGVSDGYIFATDDVTGGTWYFSAPAAFLGNKNTYYGATLRFSLFQHSSRTNQYEWADLIFRNGNQQISFKLKKYPGKQWTDYTIKIDENNGWLKGDYDSNIQATKADIDFVLSNVTAFWIRGEYETGPDEGGLDNVQFNK